MRREHFLARHEHLYRYFLDCWRSPDRRGNQDMSEDEAAYSTLEHAGLWLRHQAGGELPAELAALPLQDRMRLVLTACRSARGFALPDHFSRLLQTDQLEPEEIEEVELVLTQIDDLDAVVDLSVRLVDSLLEQDSTLLAELARTRCMVADLVRQLSVRADLVAVASRIVLVQREPRYLDDGRPADWFTRLRGELDRGFNDPSLGELVRPLPPSAVEPSIVFYPLLGPALTEYDARAISLGIAAAATLDHQSTKTQAELSLREFAVEGDDAILVRLKPLLPPVRTRPTLEVLLEHKEANGQNGISAYKAFEVFVPGLPAPLRNHFDFDINTVELDDQALEALRISGGQVAVVLVTTGGQRRPIRPR